jgi:glycosyltransferase EpsD
MSSNVLFVSNTASFSKFNLPYIDWFKTQGWNVDYASAGEEEIIGCRQNFKIPISRKPFSYGNLISIRMMRKILKYNDYKILHCHTPMGAVIARLAARKYRKTGLKVIYTAHGFHFYNGSKLLNWFTYYFIEKYLARFTDCLITINREDYECAMNRKFKTKFIFQINGVGVNLNRFAPINDSEKAQLRFKMGYQKQNFILLYIAEFIPRKNHKLLINSIAKLKEQIPNLKVIFAGKGILLEQYERKIRKLQLNEYVNFIGYRQDIEKWCQISDIHVSTSLQEGQGLNNIEAMASGLPIVCSRIRGHIDVVNDGRNGFLFDLNRPNDMIKRIIMLYEDNNLREMISKNNLADVGKYSITKSIGKMSEIYKIFMI